MSKLGVCHFDRLRARAVAIRAAVARSTMVMHESGALLRCGTGADVAADVVGLYEPQCTPVLR